jgi:hypothetical protein
MQLKSQIQVEQEDEAMLSQANGCSTSYQEGGSYMLAKLDGTISKLQFAAFHIIPYYPHCDEHVSVTKMTGVDDESIEEMEASKTIEPKEDNPEGMLYG